MKKEVVKEPIYPELEAEIAKRGLTYEQFGKEVGLSVMAVSNRLNGKVEFKVEEAKRIIEFLDKDFKDLFF